MIKKILCFLFLLPAFVHANTWKIVPSESSIHFTAIQNNAPVTGEFKVFTGDIQFDPTKLESSRIMITVDLGSVNTSYKDVADALKSADWFDIKAFPQAVFKADKFKKISDKEYTADGSLTIRDKTAPVTVNFTLDEYSSTKTHVTGNAMIKRTAFDVGKGDWANTDSVKDDVKVDFVIGASR